jgi:predicted PurR-regulated permease PerM
VGILAVAAAAWLARDVVLLVFFAVVLAIVLSYPVGWLSRLLPRGAAVLVVLVLGVAAAAEIGAFAAPIVSEQVAGIRESAPRAIADVRARLQRLGLLAGERRAGAGAPASGERGGGGGAGAGGDGGGAVSEAVAKVGSAVFRVVGGLTELVVLIVLAAFLVHEPDMYRRGVRLLVPREHERTFDELWVLLGRSLRRWVGAIAIEMAIVGTLTSLGLLAAGIQNWLVLGLLTGLATFVPYLGAIASAVPGLLVALAQSPRHLLLAAAVYVGAHLVEGYLLSPLIMRRAVEIKPALLLAGQAVLGAIFGALGIVVATPAIVCAQIAVVYLWVERRLHKAAA